MKSVKLQLASRMDVLKRISLIFSLFLAFVFSADAQTMRVSGVVKNNTGGAEAGVVIFLKSDN